MNDLKGYFFKYFDLSVSLVQRKWFTFFVYISAKARGIKMGKNCRFIGRPFISRKVNSEITIGNNCGFRSLANSNLIGINRKCIISTLLPNAKVVIGDNCGFSGVVIGAFKSVVLGKNVRCGANVLITDSDWHLEDRRAISPKEVVIENNVWLGVNVIVLKNVRIGENSVIGAGSVVTRNIPANVIAAGNPCKIIKNLN